ncbi:MAG TPA: sigma-70 family RNA polymerase sigma factor [Pyrinomonadaceae bacterium]|nr:sigma-70 family RNA polymerase sigma factor [Pyrinomonadaceae bacterium]
MAEPISEELVIAACQEGDRDAFRQLFETYKDKVFSIAIYSLGGDEAVASDVSQQVFLKLMTTIGQFRGDSAFTTWLYRLVVNACADEQRKRRRFLSFGDWTPVNKPEDKRSQEHRYAKLELADSVKGAIQELSPKLRMPILLKYVEGMSYDEIATVLDCSKGTVASRLNRGHQSLAKKLGHLRDQLVD